MFSPEFRLLLLSCRMDDKAAALEEAEEMVTSGNVDWDELYLRADLHSVRPQLAILLNRLAADLVPEDFREKLNNRYQANLYDQISYAAEFLRVRQIFHEAGIRIIPFKGFWLAHEYYGSLGDREAGDIDLFVDVSDLERIRSLMLENGYQIEKQMSGYSKKDLLRKAGEYNFERYEGDRCVFHFEFHWRISSPVYGLGISIDDLSNQAAGGTLQNQKINILSSSANLLLAVLHHGGKDPFMELKQVLDIALILKKDSNIDWEWVTGMARVFDAENLIYVAVKLASDLTGITVPLEIAAKVGSPKIGRLAANRISFMSKSPDYWHPSIFFNDWLFRIRSRTGLRTKAQLAMYITGVVARRFLLPKRWHLRETA
jgi:hypothetical protein